MSEATLISIVPFPIVEFKPGIYPGYFEIPGARGDDKPVILNIGDSVFHVEIDENRSVTVKCVAEDMARSIVNDYLTSNLSYSEENDAMPGLFWKAGRYELADVLRKFSDDLILARNRQNRWFQELVKMADDDWEKTRQHKFISDMQRYACKSLKLERPWIIIPKVGEGFKKCVACATAIPEEAIVCPNCRCILNHEKWAMLKFAEAK